MSESAKKYLKGNYYSGFKKISQSLKSEIIPLEFKQEVEDDILELLIRNQNNNKDFNEVIGNDINTFTREIINAYLSTLPKKYQYFTILKMSLVFSALVFGFSIIEQGSNLGSFSMSIICFLIGLLTYFTLYKITGKFNLKLTYVPVILGFTFGIFQNSIFKNINFINTLSTFPIDIKISLCLIIIEILIILLIDRYLRKLNFN